MEGLTKDQMILLCIMIDIFIRKGEVGLVDLDGELRLRAGRKLDLEELIMTKEILAFEKV